MKFISIWNLLLCFIWMISSVVILHFDSSRTIITGRNEVVAKVIFLHLSVILFTGGVSASVHAGIPHPPPEQTPLQSRHPPSRHPPKKTPPGSRHTHPLGADPPQSRHPHPRADTPWEQTPPGADTRQDQTPPPPGADTPLAADPPSRHPHPEQTPPRSRHPLEQTPWSRQPPQADTPPRKSDSGIRSMSGRYASYWNAFLFDKWDHIIH